MINMRFLKDRVERRNKEEGESIKEVTEYQGRENQQRIVSKLLRESIVYRSQFKEIRTEK